MSAADLPDPLDFAARALAARGALVDAREGRVEALLPAELARALALPEEVALAASPADGAAVACGIGSPLLEALTVSARAGVPWAVAAPEVDAPKASQATSLAARLVVRNGLADVVDAASLEAPYLRATVGWSVEADDRYEGAFDVAVGPDGGEPEARVTALLDPARGVGGLRPAAGDFAPLTAALPARVRAALEAATAEPLAAIERRHARDHARMTEYFAGLVAELGAGRRKVDAAALAARAAAVVAERDARLRDVVLRYTPKVEAAPVAMVGALLPAVRVRLRLRRRKAERELRVTLPAGAQALDLLACELCGGATARPALCDDRLHLACERCVPHAQGRFACGACARGR
ncbi:MAG: hypothetical protein U0324_10250 [Polyangiales bacterium]